ncbi:MAG: hypothetical protein ACTSU9_05835 [Promethearchaeota archaeon]
MTTGQGKCAKCGSSFVAATAVCKKCHTGFPLCNSCKSFWKSTKCPNCGTLFADWAIF